MFQGFLSEKIITAWARQTNVTRNNINDVTNACCYYDVTKTIQHSGKHS